MLAFSVLSLLGHRDGRGRVSLLPWVCGLSGRVGTERRQGEGVSLGRRIGWVKAG
jgi:hypothetical protein